MAQNDQVTIPKKIFDKLVNRVGLSADRLLTLVEAADYIEESSMILMSLIDRGEIKKYTVKGKPYFRPEDLNNYLTKQKEAQNG